MKKIITVIFSLMLIGCASVSIPNYIPDENPYKRNIYSNFDDTLKAASQALEELGWEIDTVTDPTVFERNKQLTTSKGRQTLLISDVRQTAMFLGSRFARVNVYLRTVNESETEMEIRYVTVNSIPFKSFYMYKQDAYVERMFRHVESILNP